MKPSVVDVSYVSATPGLLAPEQPHTGTRTKDTAPAKPRIRRISKLDCRKQAARACREIVELSLDRECAFMAARARFARATSSYWWCLVSRWPSASAVRAR